MQSLRRTISAVFLAMPLFFAAFWSAEPALQATYAAWKYNLTPIDTDRLNNSINQVNTKRQIQKHFLRDNIYIPLEDIILITDFLEKQSNLSFFMQNACGRGRIYVWVPLKFRLPIIGDRVFDWCWKPRQK